VLFGSDPEMFDRPASGKGISVSGRRDPECRKVRPSLLRIMAAQTSPELPQTVT
jgi:hypothetical protein